MRLVLAVLALLALSAASVRADPVDDIVAGQMLRARIPGAAVAIVERGRVTKLAGYGQANLEWPSPITADTPFQLASGTKLFTGVLLMRLAEQGKLSLSDPLSRFYPDAPEAFGRITVGQLASHTSGVAEATGPDRPQTVADAVKAAMAAPLAYASGAQSRYGFADFTVLRDILEKASGKPFDRLLADEITAPLGMTATRFNYARAQGAIRSAKPIPGRAGIYAFKGGEQTVSDFLYPEMGYAAGGLYASARDLATFFAALDDGRLLKPESLARLQTPWALNDGRPGGFAVAWTTGKFRGVGTAGHSGGPALSDILRLPERKVTVIVLTNQQVLMPTLAQKLMAAYVSAPPPAPAVADTWPRLTEAVRAVVVEAGEGKLDPSRFGPEAKGSLGFLGDFGTALFGTQGRLLKVEVLSESISGARVQRKYRVVFEHDVVFLRVGTDDEGHIATLQPVGEAD